MTFSLFTGWKSPITSSSNNNDYEKELSIKIIMLGESGSGKSSLSLRFSNNEFRPYSESTVGASFFETSMIYPPDEKESNDTSTLAKATDNDTNNAVPQQAVETQQQTPAIPKTKVTFKIWDTAGQEKFHALAAMYYRGAAAAILVFDISRTESFRTLQRWTEELKSKGPSDILVILCGNKSDLDLSGDRRVSQQQAEEYAKNVGALYIETSAKTSANVQEMFGQVAQKIIQDFPDRVVPKVDRSSGNGAESSCINLGARSRDPGASPCC